MFAFPRILSLMTMRRCTAACDNCAIGGSPQAHDAIPVERMRGLIGEAKRVPSIRRIVFTGGECFLLGRKLDELIAHAAGTGFETRAITNGYWAATARSASARAAALRAAGLDEIMFSTGTFHQRFVPAERIVRGARATASAGIATRISVETCDQSAFDPRVLHEALAEFIAAGTVRIAEDPWISDPGGRGANAVSNDAYVRRNGSAEGRCAQIFTVLTVTPRQLLTACCGFPLEQLASVHIGSVRERALDEVLAGAPNELLKMWLHVAGPAGIARFVARHLPGYELPGFASICEACVALQRDARAMRVLAAHAAEAVGPVTAEFVRLQSAALAS
jgi:pyruvate-formate lyase-activating enzyme